MEGCTHIRLTGAAAYPTQACDTGRASPNYYFVRYFNFVFYFFTVASVEFFNAALGRFHLCSNLQHWVTTLRAFSDRIGSCGGGFALTFYLCLEGKGVLYEGSRMLLGDNYEGKRGDKRR